MHQDHETLNGSTALIVYTLGEIRADVRTIKSEVHDGMQGLTRRLDTLERRDLSALISDLLPYLTGVVVLALALAGRWAELGQFLQR